MNRAGFNAAATKRGHNEAWYSFASLTSGSSGSFEYPRSAPITDQQKGMERQGKTLSRRLGLDASSDMQAAFNLNLPSRPRWGDTR